MYQSACQPAKSPSCVIAPHSWTPRSLKSPSTKHYVYIYI